MHRNKIVVGATLLLAAIVAASVLALPVPDSWTLPAAAFYMQLAGSALFACLHIGAAILFTMNLSVYKQKLRRAYRAIAISIIIMAYGTIQVPIVGALDAWNSLWVQRGGLILPFLASSLILYIAAQYLARIVKISHILIHVWIVLPITIGVGALSFLLPHVPIFVSEMEYDISLTGIAICTLLVLYATILIVAITRQAGTHYTLAMTWLAYALLNSVLILAIQFFYTLTATTSNGILAQLSTVLAILSGVLWLRAGATFASTKEYGRSPSLVQSLFSKLKTPAASHPRTVIDMVIYAAGLASNTSEVDPMLDNLRAITSKLQPGEKPSANDTQSLIETYLSIEQYLTTKEAIRTYTQHDLRAHLDPLLQKMINNYTNHKATV